MKVYYTADKHSLEDDLQLLRQHKDLIPVQISVRKCGYFTFELIAYDEEDDDLVVILCSKLRCGDNDLETLATIAALELFTGIQIPKKVRDEICEAELVYVNFCQKCIGIIKGEGKVSFGMLR